jgi:hypothetical protein
MATTKKSATATEKEVKPVKASVIAKPQLVAGTSTEPSIAPKKAPVAKKVAAKAAPKAPAAVAPVAAPVVKAKAPAKKAVKPVSVKIDPAQRANYIEVAAFYIAERRGFTPGNPEQDYLDAAAEIDRLIAAGQFAK